MRGARADIPRGVGAAICAGWLLAGCQVELDRRDHWAEKAQSFQQNQNKTQPAEPLQLRVVNPDGSTTLNCYLPEHLIQHLRNSVGMGESELILEQLLSEATKEAYAQEDRDPSEAVEWLITNQRDVIILLNRMTGGLSSPDVTWESMGNGFRLRLAPHLQRTFRFTTLDIIRENGQFKLLLIS